MWKYKFMVLLKESLMLFGPGKGGALWAGKPRNGTDQNLNMAVDSFSSDSLFFWSREWGGALLAGKPLNGTAQNLNMAVDSLSFDLLLFWSQEGGEHFGEGSRLSLGILEKFGLGLPPNSSES